MTTTTDPLDLPDDDEAPARHPILLVDDEPEILFSLRGLLRTEFELHTAESGAEALDVLRRRPIHAIMTDQRMPNMTGVELLRRAKEERPEAVRIVFTGYADIKAVIDAVNQGEIYRYLTKPWDPDELVAVFSQACEYYDRLSQRRLLLCDLRDHLKRCEERPDDALLPRDRGELMGRIDGALVADEGKGGLRWG
jgi:response regulator RpfG family c-di-GMP phosphodiesterase